MNNDQEVYLRVLNDLPFMFETLRTCEQQADQFPSEMLRERIIRERNAVNVEESNRREEERKRQELIELQTQHKDD